LPTFFLWRQEQERALAIHNDPCLPGMRGDVPGLLAHGDLTLDIEGRLDCSHGQPVGRSGLLHNLKLDDDSRLRFQTESGEGEDRQYRHRQKTGMIDDRRRWLRAGVCLLLKVRVGSGSYPILPARSGAERKVNHTFQFSPGLKRC
jgi:hypothetical protein